MTVNELEYNTHLERMPLPEYGRNIQRMVDYALTIEDRSERTLCANTIIRIMGNLFPTLREMPDFRSKMWDHLALMSDYKLDIDYPVDIVKPERITLKPEKVPYTVGQVKVRQYGRMVDQLIEKAVAMEDGEEKSQLIQLIANHMKKSATIMNREAAEDERICQDLKKLSGGAIDVPVESLHLVEWHEPSPQKKGKNNRRK